MNLTRFESNYCSCAGRSSEKIYVAAVDGGAKEKRTYSMKLSLSPKLMVLL
jgi:hypothetical protein